MIEIGYSKESLELIDRMFCQLVEYPFPIMDPDRIITFPIRNITAPPDWPKGEPTSTYTWIDKTWPTVKA